MELLLKKIKENLSSEQFGLCKSINGNNVVVALPGSGKTHSITYALEYLFHYFPNAKPLIVTFTNAAAGELSARLAKHLGPNFSKCRVTTFDSLMIDLVKEIDQRPVIVGSSQTPYIYRAYNYVLDEFPSSVSFDEVVASVYDYGRNGLGKREEDFGYKVYLKYREIIKAVGKYGVRDLNMVAHQVMDATKKGILSKLPYTHCLVDEFQDTDDFQLQWLLHHGRSGLKITAVGDDDQAIYSWRGASGYKNMQALVNQLGAKTHVFSLCRRCRPEIIQAAGELVGFNLRRITKKMRSSRREGGVIHFMSFESKQEQEEKIIDFLKVNQRKVGILARQNSHLEALERALVIYDIPYEKLSGKSFYEQFEVVALLHLLSALTNNSKHSIESLAHALSYFGESERVVNSVVKMANQYGSARIVGGYDDWSESTIEIMRYCAIWQGKVDIESIPELAENLSKSIHKWKPGKSRNGRSKTGVAADILLKRITNSQTNLTTSVKKLTQHLHSFKSSEKGNDKKSEEEKPLVCLSTLHSSKGLEFPVVWMLSVDEGVLPSAEGVLNIDMREEERRLAFVGMTRAEDMLIISSSNKVSSFLTESFPHIYKDDSKWVKDEIIECEF